MKNKKAEKEQAEYNKIYNKAYNKAYNDASADINRKNDSIANVNSALQQDTSKCWIYMSNGPKAHER
jgi:hypothetical protein